MRRSFTIDPYSMELVFVWNIKPKSLAKWLEKQYSIEIENLDDDFEGISVDLGQSSYLIYIPEAKPDINTYVTCIHEACHVAQWILKRVNITEEESLCYCVDNISAKLMSVLTKKKLKGRLSSSQEN